MAVQMLKHLEIRTREFACTDPKNNASGVVKQTDFLIDGEQLSKMLRLWEDPWFGRTRFEDPKNAVDMFVPQLLGEMPPRNQFGTARLVLFGCHCGCDYCGIISCEVHRDGDTIRWTDIRHEDDFGSPADYGSLDALDFAYEQYAAAIKAFVAQNY